MEYLLERAKIELTLVFYKRLRIGLI